MIPRFRLGYDQFGVKKHAPYKGIIIAASVPQPHKTIYLIYQLDLKLGHLGVLAGKKSD